MPSVTSKRRRLVDVEDIGLGPMSKSSRTSHASGTTRRGTGTLKKVMTSKEKGLSREARQKILKTQEVFRGRFFYPSVADMHGMRKLLN